MVTVLFFTGSYLWLKKRRGGIEPSDFVSFEELEERFQREWAALIGHREV